MKKTILIIIFFLPFALNPVYAETDDDLKREIDELKKRVEELEKKTDEKNALKFSGFFDVGMSNFKNQPNIFSLGVFELDIEHTYKENFQVAAALVFHRGAELGVGFIDYHLFGGSISPRGRLFVEKGIHIQVGKFDVPFGNDWQYFTSINRISVNAPLTTEMVMEGGYNDVGLRILSNFVAFNITLYTLRGIEEGYSYGGNSFGGRFGFTPFNNPYRLRAKEIPTFELGVSYIIDVDKGGSIAEKVLAVDLESKIGPVILRSEYYRRDKTVGIIHWGYHVTGGFDFSNVSIVPVILYSRYSFYRMERYILIEEENDLSRLAVGIKINIANISFLKLEYLNYIKADEYFKDEYFSENLYYVQLMITF